MRRPAIYFAALLAASLAGCSDLSDNPLHALSRSGRDARVFNPQTGHYEWPEEEVPRRRTSRTAALDEAARESSTPSKPITPGAGDNRVFNPMKQQYETPQ